MKGEQLYLRVMGFAIAVFLIIFGNRALGLGFLALMVISIFVSSRISRDSEGNIVGLYPLFAGLIWIAAGIYLIVGMLIVYERDRNEPAALFWPIFAGVGAVLCLTLGTVTIHYWKDHR